MHRLRFSKHTMHLVASVTLVAGVAHAESTSVTSADELFRSGKDRLAQKDYAHACPLFADSFRADPATGTLLALALCLEGQGKLSSAYRAYAEVANRSQREARPDREKAARTKMAILESQISWLTITLAPEVREIEGLEIKRNGTIVAPTSLDKRIPVEPGTQVIEVNATDRERWRSSVVFSSVPETKTITIPILSETEAPDPPAKTAPTPAKAAPPTPAEEPPASPVKIVAATPPTAPETTTAVSAWQGAGVATIAAGIGGLGVGTYYALRAMSKKKSSNDGCNGNVCSGQATQDRWDAYDAGNMATIGFIAGGALTLGGTALYLLARPSRVLSACSGTTCIEAAPASDGHMVGGMLSGSFW